MGELQAVAEGVYRLGSRWVNWYLVEGNGGLTVIDAGVPGYYDQLPEAVAAAGRKPADVAAVVLTHTHTDHIGCAERIRAEFGARVLTHQAERPIDVKAKPPGYIKSLWHPPMVRQYVHLLANGVTRIPPIAALERFGSDEVLDVPGKLRAVHTPGHTPGHCCLWLEDRGVVFTGDALITVDLLRGRAGPTIIPFNDDQAQARDSIRVLSRIEAAVLLPGHGDPWTGGAAEAVERALG